MNELGELFLRAMLQVTVLALAAAGLYGWAARRGPEVAARVASLGLGLCLVLTLLALCPLPSWWGWKASASAPVAPAPEPPSPPGPAADVASESEAGGDSAATGWSARDLWRACKGMLPPGTADRQPGGDWPALVAVLGSAGAGQGLLRLLIGLGAVHLCRRRARSIEDVGLREEVDSLRSALGCRRPVEVCESADLHTPATLGWLRPVVLLPAGWRGWNAGERRAALAHELAHVARADYRGALVARLSAALHFYHPVVYWLADRLRLQQELAADASAARAVGGRGCYLLALARLALRQDSRPPCWPAASFLFSHGTLLKRIAMLRAKERSEGRRRPRLAHLLRAALLLAAGLFASTLRGPAPTAAGAGSSEPAPAQRPASDPAYAPFDLSYMPPDARGVGAWRPAALFEQPGMKKYAPMMNEFATAVLLERFSGVCFLEVLQRKKPLRLSIVDIDQIVTRFHLRSNAKAPVGQRRELLFGWGSMVRTVKDFDWHKQFRDLYPDMAQTRHAGVTYYRIPRPVGFTGPQLGALFPDSRTVVLLPEKDLRRWIDHGKEWKAARAWGGAWKQVERDLAAFCARTDDLLSESEGDDPTTIALLRAAERVSIGIADCATLKAHAWIQCRNGQAAEKWEQAIHGWATQMEAVVKRKAATARAPREPHEVLEGDLEKMLARLRIVRNDSEVAVRAESPQCFAGIVEQIMAVDPEQSVTKPAGK